MRDEPNGDRPTPIPDADERIEQLEHTVDEVRAELEHTKWRGGHTADQLRAVDGAEQDLRSQMRDLRQQIIDCSSELGETRNELRAYADELVATRDELAEFRGEVGDLAGDVFNALEQVKGVATNTALILASVQKLIADAPTALEKKGTVGLLVTLVALVVARVLGIDLPVVP